MKTEETLRLVTDFGELKAFDVVLVKPCPECGSRGHRTMLYEPNTGGAEGAEAGVPFGDTVFPVDPPPKCMPITCNRRVLTRKHVAAGIVYLVIDPTSTSEETRETKQLETTR